MAELTQAEHDNAVFAAARGALMEYCGDVVERYGRRPVEPMAVVVIITTRRPVYEIDQRLADFATRLLRRDLGARLRRIEFVVDSSADAPMYSIAIEPQVFTAGSPPTSPTLDEDFRVDGTEPNEDLGDAALLVLRYGRRIVMSCPLYPGDAWRDFGRGLARFLPTVPVRFDSALQIVPRGALLRLRWARGVLTVRRTQLRMEYTAKIDGVTLAPGTERRCAPRGSISYHRTASEPTVLTYEITQEAR